MPGSSHPSRFDHLNNIQWRAQIIKFLIMQFSPAFCYNFPLTFKYSHQQPSLKHITEGEIKSSVYFIFTFLDRRWEDKIFWSEWQHALPECNLLKISLWTVILILFFPNIWILTQFQGINRLSLNYDFVLHSFDET
jgi:hypothetical protein